MSRQCMSMHVARLENQYDMFETVLHTWSWASLARSDLHRRLGRSFKGVRLTCVRSAIPMTRIAC